MVAIDSLVSLRVRLPASTWRLLTGRARTRRVSIGTYADMAWRYQWHERAPVQIPMGPPVEAEREPVYFELEIPRRTKERLADWSQSRQSSIAAFSGLVLEGFVDRYPQDPRDLVMIHYLVSKLEHAGVLTLNDLRQAVARCETNQAVRLPPGYLGKWLWQRIRSVSSTVNIAGSMVALTMEVVDGVLRSNVHAHPPKDVRIQAGEARD